MKYDVKYDSEVFKDIRITLSTKCLKVCIEIDITVVTPHMLVHIELMRAKKNNKPLQTDFTIM